MGFMRTLNKINTRFAWSFFGFVLAAFFGAVTIYSEFYKDTRPNLRFEVVGNASVFDVREQLGKLEIVYDGIDLRKSKQSLRVIILRIQNDGPDDILKGYYDDNAPLGFSITCGRIIRTELISASDPYLEHHLHVAVSAPTLATFSPVIFASQQSFSIKILIIHPEKEEPEIRPEGKVAHIRSLTLIAPEKTETSLSFWSQAFGGSPGIQIARILGYLLGLIFMFAIIGFTGEFITGKIQKVRSRRIVQRFKAQRDKPTTEIDEALLRKYVERGPFFLRDMDDILTHSDRIDEIVKIAESVSVHADSPAPIDVEDIEQEKVKSILLHARPHLISEMKRLGIIKETEDGYSINEEMKSTLADFLGYLDRDKK